MSLSRRQAQAINQIIQEEVQGALKGRNRRAELLRRGEIQERLVEAGPDAMQVDGMNLDNELAEVALSIGMEMADELVFQFRQKVVRFIAGQLNQGSTSAVRVDPRTLSEEIEDFDEDAVLEATQECMSDVAIALEKFAMQLGKLAVNMTDGTDSDEGR